MARRDKRARATGRRGAADDGVYAQIEDDVLRSDAARAMPDYALRVLLMLAAQFRGGNNGDLALSSRMAAQYGLADWKLRAGLTLLNTAGLVVQTRRGHICNGKGVPSLFALAWREIQANTKHDIPTAVARPAPNAWACWTKPADWKAIERRHRLAAQGNRERSAWPTKTSLPTRVSQADPPEWVERGAVQPTRVSQEQRIFDPPGLVPSEILAGAVPPSMTFRPAKTLKTEARSRGRSRNAQLDPRFEALDAETEFLGRASA